MGRAALHLVAPQVCELCGCTLTGGEDLLCLHCLATLPRTWTHRHGCPRITDRMALYLPGVRAAGWLRYAPSNEGAHLVHTAKYGNRPRVAFLLGRMYAQELQADGYMDTVQAIVPMPASTSRRLKRGYNQALHIARGMASVTGHPVVEALRLRGRHKSQTNFSRLQRMANAVDNDTLHLCPSMLAPGQHILLVDDIITTGSTVENAVRTLASSSSRPSCISIAAIGMTDDM